MRTRTREMTRQQFRSEGLVEIGEWGWGTGDTSGHIVCRPEDREAVAAAYDAIPDGDLSQNVLDEVYRSGGEHVVGM